MDHILQVTDDQLRSIKSWAEKSKENIQYDLKKTRNKPSEGMKNWYYQYLGSIEDLLKKIEEVI